jgi:predicted RNase H-like HicB family nuclease
MVFSEAELGFHLGSRAGAWEPEIGVGNKEIKIRVIVHEAEEGGYWAEVPAIPGCATQGETFEELWHNLDEAVEGCLSGEVEEPQTGGRVLKIAV